jgi:peroxiredoxin Q/BCP
VAYYAASVDEPAVNADFAKSLELDYPILSDPGKGVASAYGVVTAERPLAYRWTFYIGADGRILAIDKKVSAATAGKDLAGKLAELGLAKKQ